MSTGDRPEALDAAATASGAVITLRDERRVLIRPVQAGDGDALAIAFQRLSPESQRARFGSAPRALGLAALRHLIDGVDGVDHVAFAAFDDEDPTRLVAVARILRYEDDPDSLDAGITVADDYQGSGLGRVLAQVLAVHRPRPARRLVTQIAADNTRALALLAAFGEPQRRSEEGDLVVDFDD